MSWLKLAQLGDCFRMAARYAIQNRVELVHGITTNVEGKRFWHAWCEDGTNVIDPTVSNSLENPLIMPKEKWYSLVKAEVKKRYPKLRDFMPLLYNIDKKTQKERTDTKANWGPWEE